MIKLAQPVNLRRIGTMARKRIEYTRREARREQFKSIFPLDDVDTNAEYYGDDDDISTQIITNYKYDPNR